MELLPRVASTLADFAFTLINGNRTEKTARAEKDFRPVRTVYALPIACFFSKHCRVTRPRRLRCLEYKRSLRKRFAGSIPQRCVIV